MINRREFAALFGMTALTRLPKAGAATRPNASPNIVFVLTDNLGWGELGVYGGGSLRGAPTPRLDALAAEGLRLQNFNVEVSCTPSRAAFMTGRFGIRSGNIRSGAPRERHGLVRWEVTIAQLLSHRGYATAHYGKWDLGNEQGRYPNDHGFDDWYGIPRTSNEALDRLSPGYDPSVVPPEYVLEGRKGEPTRTVKEYTMEARREIDGELTERAVRFISQNAANGRPFFLYLPLTQVHYPTVPSRAFAGRTGNGDFADSMVQTDSYVGQVLDAIDHAGVRNDTLFCFTSDNGPESRRPWQGTCGFWRGYYRTTLEGSLRTPFIARWPGKIPVGVSDEIVHIADMFATLARIGGARLPTDRPIDGVDQLDFFMRLQTRSNREGFPIYAADQPQAVKWRNWKLYYVWRPDIDQPPLTPEKPYLFNVLVDPKEVAPRDSEMQDLWVMRTLTGVMKEFQESLKKYPPIPPHTPDPYTPPWKA